MNNSWEQKGLSTREYPHAEARPNRGNRILLTRDQQPISEFFFGYPNEEKRVLREIPTNQLHDFLVLGDVRASARTELMKNSGQSRKDSTAGTYLIEQVSPDCVVE